MPPEGFKETETGLIPEDWKVKKIKNVCKQVREPFNPNEDDIRPYIGLEHINENSLTLNGIGSSSDVKSGKLVFSKGQILFGKLRPYFRKVYRPNFDGVCSTDIFVIDKKDNYDNEFLFYFFANPLIIDIATQSSEGTRMPRASWSYLSDLDFAFPTFQEQKAIGRILSSLDKKIKLNNQTNQTLEEIGQAIFRQWFVHFEFPDENGQPYKSSGGEMVDSDLGEIPVGWEVKKFKNCVELIIDHRGKTPTKLEGKWSSSGISALSAKNIKNGKIVNKESIKFVDSELYFKWMKDKIKREDILLTSEAPLGEMVSWDFDEKIVLSQRLFGIRANRKVLSPKYLYCFMNSGLFKYELKSRATGSTVQGIRQAELINTNVIVPPLQFTTEFQNLIGPLFIKMTLNEKESDNLSKIRDSLLPKLMSGKIRV